MYQLTHNTEQKSFSMAISKRQFDILNAMDIPLWVSRAVVAEKKPSTQHPLSTPEVLPETPPPIAPVKAGTNKQHPITVTNNINKIENEKLWLVELNTTRLFSDILLSLGFNTSDVKVVDGHLTMVNQNMHQLTWQFSSSQPLSFSDNTLITPSIERLSTSPLLKRQLWQLMKQNNLS